MIRAHSFINSIISHNNMSDCTLPNRYFDDCHGGLKWEHAYVQWEKQSEKEHAPVKRYHQQTEV